MQDILAAIGQLFEFAYDLFRLKIPGLQFSFFALLCAPLIFSLALGLIALAFGMPTGGENYGSSGSGKQYRLSSKRSHDEK